MTNEQQHVHPPQDNPLTRDTDTPELDVPDFRAKNSGHGKKTADKWNQ